MEALSYHVKENGLSLPQGVWLAGCRPLKPSSARPGDHRKSDVDHALRNRPPFYLVDDEARRLATDGIAIDLDGRKRGVGVGRKIQIAKAHDGELIRNFQSPGLRFNQDSQR